MVRLPTEVVCWTVSKTFGKYEYDECDLYTINIYINKIIIIVLTI